MRLALVAVVALVMLAGCSGTPPPPAASSTGPGGGDGNGGGGSGGSGGPGAGGGDGGGVAPARWNETSFTGSFEALPGGASGATGAYPDFALGNATEAWFNVTFTTAVPSGTPATEFDVEFHDSDHLGLTDAAQATATTTGGSVAVHVDSPKDGAWKMAIFSSGAPNQGSFVLKVNTHMPA